MIRSAALILGLFLAVSAAAQDSVSLRESRAADLQSALDRALAELRLDRAVREQRLAVTVVDLADPGAPRMAGVNDQRMLYSASLPKIAILLGAFERVAEGSLALDESLRRDLEAMIRHSSNAAATRVLDRVGRVYLAELLMAPRYRLYDAGLGGGLWVGKAYGPEPAFRRDPLHNLSHGATTLQVARYYYLLETGHLVSPQASQEMKAVLGNPGIRHKFVKGLYSEHPQAAIYRKSGTWRDFHADSAIVEHDGKRYILAALAHDPRGGAWLEQLALAVDRLIPASSSVAQARAR